MDTARRILVLFVLAATICALIALALMFHRVGKTAERLQALPDEIDLLVRAESKTLRGETLARVDDLISEVKDARKASDRQITAARSDLRGESEAWRGMVDQRLVGVEVMAAGRIDRLTDMVLTVTSPTAKLLTQIETVAPLWLDCEGNPDCAFNRFQGTSKAVEKMAMESAKASPEVSQSTVRIAQNVGQITADVGVVTRNVAEVSERLAHPAPKKWWRHVLDFTGVGAVVARLFL